MTGGIKQIEWPDDVDRTPYDERKSPHGNNATKQGAAKDVLSTLELMGVDLETVDLQTNVRHYDADPNVPARTTGDPPDPGVVLRFTVRNEDVVVACDASPKVKDNLVGIREHVDHIHTAHGTEIQPSHFHQKVGIHQPF